MTSSSPTPPPQPEPPQQSSAPSSSVPANDGPAPWAPQNNSGSSAAPSFGSPVSATAAGDASSSPGGQHGTPTDAPASAPGVAAPASQSTSDAGTGAVEAPAPTSGAAAASDASSSDGSSKKKWLPWAIGGCGCLFLASLAALALIIVLIVVNSSSPDKTVQSHHDAWLESDCETLMDTTTSDYRYYMDWETCTDFGEDVEGVTEVETKVTNTSSHGDYATVTADVTMEGEIGYSSSTQTVRGTIVYSLVKEDGRWKIDSGEFTEH